MTITYEWQRDGVSISGETSSSSYTPVAADIGTRLSCLVSVSGLEATAEATADTVSGDTSPVIGNITTRTYEQGDAVSITPSLSGGDAPFEWSFASGGNPLGASIRISSSTGRITGTINAGQSPDRYTVTIQVEDDDGDTDTETFTIRITEADTRPRILNISNVQIDRGDSVSINVAAAGGVGNLPLDWSLSTNPLGLSIRRTGTYTAIITGSISSIQSLGNYSTTVRVEDDDGDSDTDTFLIEVVIPDSTPTIANISNISVQQGGRVNIQARASGGNPPLSWSLGFNTLGLSISSSGRITGSISSSQNPTGYVIEVIVEDDDGDTDTELFSITVTALVSTLSASLDDSSPVPGQRITCTASGGTGSYAYQWQRRHSYILSKHLRSDQQKIYYSKNWRRWYLPMLRYKWWFYSLCNDVDCFVRLRRMRMSFDTQSDLRAVLVFMNTELGLSLPYGYDPGSLPEGHDRPYRRRLGGLRVEPSSCCCRFYLT